MDRLYSARTDASKLYSVGAYIRLSVENTLYDSDSVENQREMLSKFIDLMPGWSVHRFYIDNGVSGGTFDRPAFQEMMADVRNGLVSLVLVKDLSRWGRNYIEAGRYLEEELPALGCRFVALADGVDTENGENDIVPFLNALNDFHIKTISERIRLVLHAKARDGQKLGRPPYGFLRDPLNRNHLIIDDYAADVVRRMFEMRRQGVGFYTIVKALNSEGILSPKLYYRVNNGMDTTRLSHKKWIDCTVSAMLRNEIYIGNAVQLKNKMVSYRDRREVKRPEEEWIRVENAFPAIIDRETWDAVQEVNLRSSRIYADSRSPRKSLFSGLLSCRGCGATMLLSQSPYRNISGERHVHLSYLCRTYSATAGISCSRHGVSELTLKHVVMEDIRRMAAQIMLDEDAMLQSLMRQLNVGEGASKADTETERRMLRQQLQKIEAAMAQLYEDRVACIISGETFSDMVKEYEAERLEKEQRLSLLERTKQEADAKLTDVRCWMQLIRENALLTDVNRDLLEALVEKIEVGEREVVYGEKRQDIRIIYRFVGLV